MKDDNGVCGIFTNSRREIFDFLRTVSGVTVSTSAVIGGVVSKGHVLVREAPPYAVKELTRRFVMVSLTADGLLIPCGED